MSKKAAYFTLLGLVIDQLPQNAASTYIAEVRPNVNAQRIVSCIAGTTKDLPLLADIVKHALPEFEIPANIAEQV